MVYTIARLYEFRIGAYAEVNNLNNGGYVMQYKMEKQQVGMFDVFAIGKLKNIRAASGLYRVVKTSGLLNVALLILVITQQKKVRLTRL